MHGMGSALLFRSRRFAAGGDRFHQFVRRQAEALNGCVNAGPLFGEKLLAFAKQQEIAGTGIDEHAETSLFLDKLLVDQLLIALQDREWIDTILGRDVAHGWQRITFVQRAIEDHRDHAVAKLAVNRLAVVPLSIHSVLVY